MPPPNQQNDPVANLRLGFRALMVQMKATRQRLYALEASQRLAASGRQPRYPVEFKSQFGEDLLVYDLFEGKPEGFFIEVGAFDGYDLSVTYALECMGWNGLLIEAIPNRAEQCAARRKHSRVAHAALSRRGSTGTTTFTVTEDIYGGMLSYHHQNADHVKSIGTLKRKTVTVPLTTMDELLKDHQGEIDLASIDVEGGEVPLLQGFDLMKHRPKVLLLEENTGGKDQTLANYMKTQPYVMMGWLEVNMVFVRADLTDLQVRCHRLFTTGS